MGINLDLNFLRTFFNPQDTHSGPVVHVKALRSGKATILCLLTDPNYQVRIVFLNLSRAGRFLLCRLRLLLYSMIEKQLKQFSHKYLTNFSYKV